MGEMTPAEIETRMREHLAQVDKRIAEALLSDQDRSHRRVMWLAGWVIALMSAATGLAIATFVRSL